MSLIPLQGFEHFTTHHCVTGSLRHIYHFNGYPISEEMLLGLGSGIGFIYWHMKGMQPFLGGRANAGRPGEEGLERAVGRCTGVRVEIKRSGSADRAEKLMLEHLLAGQPVMILLDMGFLPYFDFGGEQYHFGYHAVVVCGCDPESGSVLLADRDEALHPVSLEALKQARSSTYQPFPPQNTWYEFEFSKRPRQAEPTEIFQAMAQCTRSMLTPPITNLGIKGIRKAAQRIREWPRILAAKELCDTCINTAIMIDARGGTGGGLFRYMYARFLLEAADLVNQPDLKDVAQHMYAAGDGWQEAAGLFEQAYHASNPGDMLEKICHLLPLIADQEELAWCSLHDIIASVPGG